MKRSMFAAGIVLALGTFVLAEMTEPQIVDSVQNSLVRVEYTLQFDKGESPQVAGWGKRCPNCGQFHNLGDGSELVKQERPLETCGFVISPDMIVSPDVMIHPRFVKKIVVHFGNQLINAKPVSYAIGQKAVILKLASPLKNAKPIEFKRNGDKPFKIVTYSELNGLWTSIVKEMSMSVSKLETGEQFVAVPSDCLIVDANGAAIGISMKDRLPLDNSWQGSPLNWQNFSSQKIEELLKALEEKVDRGIVRVELNFRSPKVEGGMEMFGRYFHDETDSELEMSVAGVIFDSHSILVLANLKPKVTARLETVTIHTADGNEIKALFAGTLGDYGGFIAKTDQPLNGTVAFATTPITACRDKLLLYADIIMQGEKRVVYLGHSRVASFEIGWRRQLSPQLAGKFNDRFLFDTDGQLLTMPLTKREKITSEENRWASEDKQAIPVVYLKNILANLADNIDTSNIPLSEEEETRLAWMGVELQPLNRELARINNVSNLTQDGRTGAIVSYVYANSPAVDAGIELGFILLRLHAEGLPKPIDITLDESFYSDMGGFWEMLSGMPEEYFDQIPTPWPNVENSFTRAISDLGFGKSYTAEFFHDGETIMKNFAIVQSPPYYSSASRYKSDALGMTVKDLTYEVRRYFRLQNDKPGVIVSKLEPGSKASVAGIRPYEIITHVNDNSVQTVKTFEELIQNQPQLKLFVKRMAQGRVVTIKTDPAIESTKAEKDNNVNLFPIPITDNIAEEAFEKP